MEEMKDESDPPGHSINPWPRQLLNLMDYPVGKSVICAGMYFCMSESVGCFKDDCW